MEKMSSELCNNLTDIIDISTETIWLFRQQYFFRANKVLNRLTSELQEVIQSIK